MPPLLVNFIQLLALVLWVLILARVVVSWIAPTSGGPLVAFIYQVTEPLLAPIRRLLPSTGGLDLSPMIAILLLGVIARLLIGG